MKRNLIAGQPRQPRMYEQVTLECAEDEAKEIADKFLYQVQHLLKSGAIDRTKHNRQVLFISALGNVISEMSETYLRMCK